MKVKEIYKKVAESPRNKNRPKSILGLSASEIFAGIILYLPEDYCFTEQKIYKFFHAIESTNPDIRDRFRVSNSLNDLKSEPLRTVLSFMEMGRILEMPMNSDFYRVNKSMLDSIRRELHDRLLCPSYEPIFKKLAEDFLISD